MNGLHSVLLSRQPFTIASHIALTLLAIGFVTAIAASAFAEQINALDNSESDDLVQVAEPPKKNQQQEHDHFVKSVQKRKLSIDQTLRELGLEAPRSCLDFSDKALLNARKIHWASALDMLHHTHPLELTGWIIGKTRPPQTAIREAELQKNCMLTAIINDVTRSPHKLRVILDFNYTFDGEINGPRQLAALFAQTPNRRREIFNKVTLSGYRNAISQSQIWIRKYRFQGRSFNAVTDQAAERCGLETSQTWKPGYTSHKNCWFHNLTPEEREREILQASSAPGISRHHWATDFDLFSLNTRNFIENAPHHGDHLWMQENALFFGYFQPYQGIASNAGQSGYMEERWHWSYLPISQALYDFVLQHQSAIQNALFEQWDEFEARSNRGHHESATFFPFVRENWRAYMFHVDPPHKRRSPTPTNDAPPTQTSPHPN